MTRSHTSQPMAPRRIFHALSQADLCRICSAAKSTVNKAFRTYLAPAVLSDGAIDGDHSLTIRFMARHMAAEKFAVYPEAFAEMAGCSVAEVKAALERGGSLLPALTLDWMIRATHPAALKFLRAHPFQLDASFCPIDPPQILETTDAEDRQWTNLHPLSQVYGAREDGALDLRNSRAGQ